MTRPAEVPRAQRDPSALPEGEPWWTVCAVTVPYSVGADHKLRREPGECGAELQGGIAGLEAHVATVHPGKAATYREIDGSA